MGYSVVLPTLNEAGHIVKLIENIIDVFSKIHEEFEVIIVDDNSTDGTTNLVENIAKEHKNIKFLYNLKEKNYLYKGLKV